MIITAKVYRRRKARREESYAAGWTPAAVRSENVVTDRELDKFNQYIAQLRSKNNGAAKS